MYGDAFIGLGQDKLGSVCAVALQLRGAQPSPMMAVRFLGECGFGTQVVKCIKCFGLWSLKRSHVKRGY